MDTLPTEEGDMMERCRMSLMAPWPPAGFSLPPENYHLFSLSLTLPALWLLLSPMELHKIAKQNGSPDSLLVVHLSSQGQAADSHRPVYLHPTRVVPTWYSPRCALVAGSAACCQVPAVVT